MLCTIGHRSSMTACCMTKTSVGRLRWFSIVLEAYLGPRRGVEESGTCGCSLSMTCIYCAHQHGLVIGEFEAELYMLASCQGYYLITPTQADHPPFMLGLLIVGSPGGSCSHFPTMLGNFNTRDLFNHFFCETAKGNPGLW
ncbi:hypothetical protein GOODEAATRI_016030 [Goodea atripinnis]|uniref:Uncharacterized protein n=1 Tax=Goodea atripinnis TaxID=208336 RepID=A0ABV0NE98_9TELE